MRKSALEELYRKHSPFHSHRHHLRLPFGHRHPPWYQRGADALPSLPRPHVPARLQHRIPKLAHHRKATGMGAGGTALIAGAVALAAAAVYVRYKSHQAERENPPLGRFIEVDGVRLHYVERGEGETLVLLHGNGSMVQDLAISGLLDQASSHYRVIAFDRPGYGHSERPRGRSWTPKAQAHLLHKALVELRVDRPIVAAHSWGTLPALTLALEYPDSVRSLVLLSGYYFPSARLDAPLATPSAIPVLGDLLRHTVMPLVARAVWPARIRRLFSPARVPPRSERFPVWMALRPSQLHAEAAETALMIPSAVGLRRRYRELKMPVVIMAGADDQFVNTQQQSARLHDELPHSSLRLASGVGHMVHYLAPDEVMAAFDLAAQTT